jgi:hypothetical protein
MSLEALAPDQRAVVQLVLQQERSYDDLAGLLGISTEAVRERARAGLERVGGSAGDLTEEERSEIADYLLGQQSVSRREATRSLLASSPDGRRWANRVTDALADVARTPLPGVPDGEDDQDDFDDEPFPTVPEPAPETTAPALALPDEDDEAEDEAEDEADGGEAETATTTVRARPRPRPDAARPRPSGAGGGRGDAPRASRLGGALLIAGIALILVVVVVVVLGGGDDNGNNDEEPVATATATATAEATPQAAGAIELKGVNGSNAKGSMTIFVSQDGQVAFTIEGSSVPVSKEGEAYAVWLTGGPRPKRLGFAPTVGEDGKLGVSGPREGDAESFPQDFGQAKKVIVSRETSQDATKPGPAIMSGDVPQASG